MTRKVKKAKAPKIKNLGWRLLGGSHEFPGPDGGTCINEAAIIARGFEYRAVESEKDFPPCFSKLIGVFALKLNDDLSDISDLLLNEYMTPFVVKLAGTTDSIVNERKRARYMLEQVASFIYKNSFDGQDLSDDLEGAEPEQVDAIVKDFVRKRDIKNPIKTAKYRVPDRLTRAYKTVGKTKKENLVTFADLAVAELSSALSDNDGGVALAKAGTAILEGMIMMGKHAKRADWKNIKKRLDAYKAQAKKAPETHRY